MATTYIGMVLPTPSVTVGATWATNLNTALELVDAHDHSSGKGVKVPSSGININADLDYGGYQITTLKANKFSDQAATLTGASNAYKIYTVNGNLYYTNSGGTAVQITSGGSVVTSPSTTTTFSTTSVTGNVTILSSDTFVTLLTTTTGARQITLPLASSVSAGRFYIVKDITGSCLANNITIARQGSDTIDGDTSYVLNSSYGSWMIISDGTASWYVL